jgi:predicted phosphodiesterase
VRIGLFSDCEGNAAALEAVLAALRRAGPDVLVCAGDILTSPLSPDPPSDTIGQLRAADILAIPGNTDRYLLDWSTPRWQHTLWMRLRRSDPVGPWLDQIAEGQAMIPPADLAWLRALPEERTLDDGRVYICHGMPGNPWNTIWPRSPIYDANVSDADRDASLRMLGPADLVLCGHAPHPTQFHDRTPDGRPLLIVRAGPRTPTHVGYALITRGSGGWQAEWGSAEIAKPS